MEYKTLQNKIRLLILFFIVALAMSGITAFPIQTELQYLADHKHLLPDFMEPWIMEVYTGIKNTYNQYLFIGYGTDWLAFAHLVIAINFIGPLKNPVKKHLGYSIRNAGLRAYYSFGNDCRRNQANPNLLAGAGLRFRCLWYYPFIHVL